jgi:plasmid stabilization system protein ParE
MASSKFRVVFTKSAAEDLEEIARYWSERNEPERGARYANDLPEEAIRELTDPAKARSGRYLVKTIVPRAQELSVFKRSYRILYRVSEGEANGRSSPLLA